MILNLFSYPSNFGQISLYKCDVFGTRKTSRRYAMCDSFEVSVEQETMDEELLFGGYNQSNYFKLENRNISINCGFLFAKSLNGTIDPALDLIFNTSAYAFQGTLAPLKLTLVSVNSTEANYAQPLPFQSLNMSVEYPAYLFYFVNQNKEMVQIFPNAVNTLTQTISYSSVAVPSNCWLEVYRYGNVDTLEPFPLYREPMFRLDCSEGSFYPCIVDTLTMSFQEDYVKISCKINAVNFDRSERYGFINATNVSSMTPLINPVHKSRARIVSQSNDVASDFNIVDLKTIDYMDALSTQKFSPTPITEISLNIQNGVKPIYSNLYEKMPRTYVTGFISEKRSVNGTLKALALRSVGPTFNRYPFLSDNSSKSLAIQFENQILRVPYTVWKPGKITLQQGQYSVVDLNWNAITRTREGQPVFTMEGES